MIITKTYIDKYPVKRGKVRDVYDIGNDRLVIVTTDRISAFDHILPTPIPRRGEVLTKITEFWLNLLGKTHHLITTDEKLMPPEFHELKGRCMLVWKTVPCLVECVVRGYLCGSGWKDYKATGKVCGNHLPPLLQENMWLSAPIYTPATKAQVGHDENISFTETEKILKNDKIPDLASKLRAMSLEMYTTAAEHAFKNAGILIADTKFEFGIYKNEVYPLVIDEVLTPDSSRFWDVKDYRLGGSPPSYDKQIVRDYLEQTGWDKESAPPELSDDIVQRTSERYLEAYKRLTGKEL